MSGSLRADGGQPLLAVLPFTVLGEAADPLLAQGLHGSVCSELTRFRSLKVISPATAALVADQPDEEIARRIRATHVLRAQFRVAGERLRLSASLSEAGTATQVWSERLEIAAEDAFALEEEIVGRISASLNARLEAAALAGARRHTGDPAAHVLVLQGRALVREGTPEADAAARALFERALALDPHLARAHAGLACTWFNEWSCQFWDRFDENGRLAYAHAHRALALDDRDAFLHQVVGKICLFRRDFERASWYFDRALALCPNDAELVAVQALYESYLGRPEIGIEHVSRAMRLNPYHPPYYFGFAAFAHLLAGQTADAIELIGRSEGIANVDVPAYWAAAFAGAGRLDEARAHFDQYEANYREKIACGRVPSPGETVRWFADMNPFRRRQDLDLFLEAFRRIGAHAPRPVAADPAEAALLRAGSGWIVDFAGERAHLPHLKGVSDLRALLERPDAELHCLDLAGREVEGLAEAVLDDRSRTALKVRIRDLQEDLAEAEDANDLGRAERVREELDGLVDALAAALGLGGRSRRLGDVAEKARTAVTWRIRHAIRRIEKVHPPLGRHLANSVRTGTFCVYRPENPVGWRFAAEAPAQPAA